jgi:mandelate racemase
VTSHLEQEPRSTTLAESLTLMDLYTEPGVIGRSYLGPLDPQIDALSLPALSDLGGMLKDRRLAPIEFREVARKYAASHAAAPIAILP